MRIAAPAAAQGLGFLALPRIRRWTSTEGRYLRPRRQILAGRLVRQKRGRDRRAHLRPDPDSQRFPPHFDIGVAEVAEGERVDPFTYRFFVLDEAALRAGAPIRLGWAGLKAPVTRRKTSNTRRRCTGPAAGRGQAYQGSRPDVKQGPRKASASSAGFSSG